MNFYKKTNIYRGDNELYLVRRSLFSCRWFAIKIHNIILSDDDCLHDHPWAFITLILWGGYLEHSMCEIPTVIQGRRFGKSYKIARFYRPGAILYRPAEFKHRLQIFKPAWTLVITFKKVRHWGFWTSKGWIPWRDYKTSSSPCE